VIARGSLIIALVCAGVATASAQPAADEAAPAPAVTARLAVMPMDALGMDADRVARLETLFRKEIELLSGAPLPTRRQIEQLVAKSRRLRQCGAADACLAEVGKKLEVDLVVSGNVAALGDSYVVDIKVVDVATGEQIRRIQSDPLRGEPDELIEAVRVAAYRLLAPEALHGSIMVLTNLVGAAVTLDGQQLGTTPLPKPIARLPLGEHRLRVAAEGYEPFEEPVRVRFQKTSRVLVTLVIDDLGPSAPMALDMPGVRQPRPAPERWYQSTWFLVGAGVTAAVVGGYVGYRLARDPVIDCQSDPMSCFE
jgi:hypothetical protein